MRTAEHNGNDRIVSTGGASTAAIAEKSAVSWAAIFAGALAAGILSLLLFMLGIGLGLSSISVWSGKGADGETIGWVAVAWLVFTQLASAGVGGYIAGRLRTKWQGIHTDEVYFRDTAHGFLSWALATILMVALMGSVAGAALMGTVKTAGAVASGAAQVVGGAVSAVTGAVEGTASAAVTGIVGVAADKAGKQSQSTDFSYWISGLLRKGSPSEQQKQEMKDGAQDATNTVQSAASDAREISIIFSHSLQAGSLSEDDAKYLSQLITQRTGMNSDEAQQKVQKTFEQVQQQVEKAKQVAKDAEEKAKHAAELARKATAYSMLWMFVVLLIGAFIGSVSATFGGRQRDA